MHTLTRAEVRELDRLAIEEFGLGHDVRLLLAAPRGAVATATFVAAKPGFAAPGAREFTGAVHVLGIGAPAALLGRFGISPAE
jgi:hypothetical protein